MAKTSRDGRPPSLFLEDTIPKTTWRRLAEHLQTLSDPEFRKVGHALAAALDAEGQQPPAPQPGE